MTLFRLTTNSIRDHRVALLASLIILFVLIRSTTAASRSSNVTFRSRSSPTQPLTHRAVAVRPSRKSHSIEVLKRRLANRTNSFKTSRTLLLTSTTTVPPTTAGVVNTTTQRTSTVNLPDDLFSSPSALQTLAVSGPLNATLVAILFLCCFCGFVLLTLIVTFFLRENINGVYFKLPCIHLLSTTKQSRDSTPLFYSPIQSKFTITEEFPVEQLYSIYMQQHALDDLDFAVEFKSLPNFDELPCFSATRTIVASKNRFLNILPIDTTRVILRTLNDDPATDYINGNYISGYKCANKFIATQGPKPDTCEDFWRMIWELKLKSIVMLTNTIEGVSRMTKCHQYWPELEQTITYGSYQITCVDRQSLCDYEKRYFQLLKISNDEELHASSSLTADDASSFNLTDHEQPQYRLVVQYHYTQWKDMDVPNDSHTLLQLIHEVNEHTDFEQYPIVVHCTAGVGRTGTYIAIDAMIDKIKQEGKVDIYNFVLQMRRERHLMVQTVKQYAFIYRSLLEYYLYGNTRIEANMFQSTYSSYKKNGQAALLSEYNKLSLLPPEHVTYRDAHSSENIEKNRCSEIVPYDHNRVCLSRILGHPYINASFIEAYPRERSFIITQDPLENTVHEFWRMFIEHDCDCIVQLHTFREVSPGCAAYYPHAVDSTMKIGTTSLLQLIDEEIMQDKFIIRRFYLTDTREVLSKTIYHYEYLPPLSTNDEYENGQCIPAVPTHHLFDFIGQINKRANGTDQPRHITVHCGNGGPACSLFCLSVILLAQLKNEQAVDIFQCVRALRRQRSATITSLAQYAYLYEFIDKFLEESFDNPSIERSPSLNNSIYDNEEEQLRHLF